MRPAPVRTPPAHSAEALWDLAVTSGASVPVLATMAGFLQLEASEHFLPAGRYATDAALAPGEVGRYLGHSVVVTDGDVVISALPQRRTEHWRCSYCGQLQPVGRLACSQCGGGRG